MAAAQRGAAHIALQMSRDELTAELLTLRRNHSQIVEAMRTWEAESTAIQTHTNTQLATLRSRNSELEKRLRKDDNKILKRLRSAEEEAARLVEELRSCKAAANRKQTDEFLRLRQQIAHLSSQLESMTKRCAAAEGNLAKLRRKHYVRMLESEEIQQAQKERTAMQRQLESMIKHHADTELHKEQTVGYLRRYERELRLLQEENNALREECRNLKRELADSASASSSGRQEKGT